MVIEPSLPRPPAAEPEAEPEPPPTLVGRWKGLGKQASGPSWQMTVEVTSSEQGRCAVVSYDSCAGHWECTASSDWRQLTAVEHITSGGGCIVRVDVQLTLSADGATAKFVAEVPGDSAEATLERTP